MTDDKDNKGSPDRDRIDVNDPNELEYWADAFNTTKEQIKEAVNQVGTSATRVKEYINH